MDIISKETSQSFILFRDNNIIPNFYFMSWSDEDSTDIRTLISNSNTIKELCDTLELKTFPCRICRIDEITHIYNSVNKEGLV